MTDTTIPIRDAGANGRARRVLDDGPAGIAPVNAEHPQQRAELLGALSPLASRKLVASGAAAVSESRTAARRTAVFTPVPGRPFNVTIDGGEGVVATVDRDFGDGSGWHTVISDAVRQGLPASFTLEETEAGVTYSINLTAISAGNCYMRLSA